MSIPIHIATALDNRRFHLILFVTEQCNFRCTYCYEEFLHGTMPERVVSGVKAFLRKKMPQLDQLTISWFGGEPLLAHRVISDISENISSFSVTNPNFYFQANMTTNGYLLSFARFEELLSYRVSSFQISLDGDYALHNKTRIQRNSGETFEQVWENLLMTRKSRRDFRVVIRVHYTSSSWRQLDSLIRMLNDNFSNDSRYEIHFAPINALGGPGHSTVKSMSEQEKADIREHLIQQLSPTLASHKLNSDDTPYVCYASKANSLAVRADGRLAKCTVALSSNKNNLGKILEDGTIDIDHEVLRPWLSGLITGDSRTLGCPYPSVVLSTTPSSLSDSDSR